MNHSKKKVSPGLLAMFGVSEAEYIEATKESRELATMAEDFQRRPRTEATETENA